MRYFVYALTVCARNDLGGPPCQSDILLTHTFIFAASLFLFFFNVHGKSLIFFMYENLYNMCMLTCDILAVYFCVLICDFVDSTIVRRNKSPTGLMLCHISHIRRKINFLYLYLFCILLPNSQQSV